MPLKMASMTRLVTNRDYSLVGPEAARATTSGLANGEWYKSPAPRARLRELMQRRDGPAIRDTAIWLGSLLVLGTLGTWLWGSWWAVAVFAGYGVLYASAADSRWRECGHRTAFKTTRLDDAVYAFASFLLNLLGGTQHLGLAEDVLDHRLDSRAVCMNPLFRFICWNMNYHVEHHMYPMVPYQALPRLHEEIKADCPAPMPSVYVARTEILPTLLRRLNDAGHFNQEGAAPRGRTSPGTGRHRRWPKVTALAVDTR